MRLGDNTSVLIIGKIEHINLCMRKNLSGSSLKNISPTFFWLKVFISTIYNSHLSTNINQWFRARFIIKNQYRKLDIRAWLLAKLGI